VAGTNGLLTQSDVSLVASPWLISKCISSAATPDFSAWVGNWTETVNEKVTGTYSIDEVSVGELRISCYTSKCKQNNFQITNLESTNGYSSSILFTMSYDAPQGVVRLYYILNSGTTITGPVFKTLPGTQPGCTAQRLILSGSAF